MSWLVDARTAVVDALAGQLGEVPVLGYEPRGDHSGGTYVTVTIVAAEANEVTLRVRAVDELRHDRTQQDTLDELVDLIDTLVPAGVFLADWAFDVDELVGAVVATGTFRAPRYSGWCDPISPT